MKTFVQKDFQAPYLKWLVTNWLVDWIWAINKCWLLNNTIKWLKYQVEDIFIIDNEKLLRKTFWKVEHKSR